MRYRCNKLYSTPSKRAARFERRFESKVLIDMELDSFMKKQLMHSIYQGNGEVSELSLNDTERTAIELCIESVDFTAVDLAEYAGHTLQYASTLLKKLSEKGYLGRVPDPRSTNGLSYIYNCDPEQWGN